MCLYIKQSNTHTGLRWKSLARSSKHAKQHSLSLFPNWGGGYWSPKGSRLFRPSPPPRQKHPASIDSPSHKATLKNTLNRKLSLTAPLFDEQMEKATYLFLLNVLPVTILKSTKLSKNEAYPQTFTECEPAFVLFPTQISCTFFMLYLRTLHFSIVIKISGLQRACWQKWLGANIQRDVKCQMSSVLLGDSVFFLKWQHRGSQTSWMSNKTQRAK